MHPFYFLFGFHAQTDQAFDASGVSKLVGDLSGKDKTQTCPSTDHPVTIQAVYAFKRAPRRSLEVEFVAHLKRDSLLPLLFYTIDHT